MGINAISLSFGWFFDVGIKGIKILKPFLPFMSSFLSKSGWNCHLISSYARYETRWT